jgi:hypothetical protein
MVNVWFIVHSFSCVNFICDICFYLQMLLNIFIAYYDEYGNLIEDLTLVRKHYFRNPSGFFLDFLSVIPFEAFALAAPKHVQMEVFSYIHLIHLVRIIHVKRFFNDRSQELTEKYV